MARKPAADAAPAPAWAATIDATLVPLIPSLPALLAIEQGTGRTIFELLEATETRSVRLEHLAIILRCLAGPACPLGYLNPPLAPLFVLSPDNDPAAGAVVRSGMLVVLADLMAPLLAALKGEVDEAGAPIAKAA